MLCNFTCSISPIFYQYNLFLAERLPYFPCLSLFAILKAICPDLISHDILSARLLQLRQTATIYETGNGEDAEPPEVRHATMPSQILVTVHSSSSVKQVISDKVKLGKLHSSRIFGSLAGQSG